MNKLYAFLLLLPTAGAAQPIITSDIQPLPGDECHYMLNPDGFNYGLGPDQYWDLSTIPFTPSSTAVYVLPDTTPGFVHFPGSDVALSSSFGFEYYDMTPDAWNVIGLYLLGTGEHIDVVDPMVVMPFPWSYGTVWEDPYSYENDGEMWYDTIRWEASTHGTVRLPGGTEVEVVGMVEFDVDLDTMSGTTYFDEDVYLYAPGIRCRVASFGRSWSVNPGWPPGDTTSYARALDAATIGLPERVAEAGLELWPVPSNGTLNMRWPQVHGAVHVQVFDATGRVVSQGTSVMHDEATVIDTRTLMVGTYLLRVTTHDGRSTTEAFTVE